jgi:hypothetical protein
MSGNRYGVCWIRIGVLGCIASLVAALAIWAASGDSFFYEHPALWFRLCEMTFIGMVVCYALLIILLCVAAVWGLLKATSMLWRKS